VSATIGLLLKIVLLPFIILSLGVVYFLINGLMLKLASEFARMIATRRRHGLYWMAGGSNAVGSVIWPMH